MVFIEHLFIFIASPITRLVSGVVVPGAMSGAAAVLVIVEWRTVYVVPSFAVLFHAINSCYVPGDVQRS